MTPDDAPYARFNRKRNFLSASVGWDGVTICIVKDGQQSAFCLKAHEAEELIGVLEEFLERGSSDD